MCYALKKARFELTFWDGKHWPILASIYFFISTTCLGYWLLQTPSCPSSSSQTCDERRKEFWEYFTRCHMPWLFHHLTSRSSSWNPSRPDCRPGASREEYGVDAISLISIFKWFRTKVSWKKSPCFEFCYCVRFRLFGYCSVLPCVCMSFGGDRIRAEGKRGTVKSGFPAPALPGEKKKKTSLNGGIRTGVSLFFALPNDISQRYLCRTLKLTLPRSSACSGCDRVAQATKINWEKNVLWGKNTMQIELHCVS